jgi:short subunit dehydrogenase-like uncharacterized protein
MSAAVAIGARESRRFDVVVWGATGFTGKLVAEYLAKAYPSGLAWALAGRSKDKLEAVRATLGDAGRGIPILIADAADRASLDAVVHSTRVVLTTVGPYGLYGKPLVAACVDAGTDYTDLAGETPFIREMIDAHHARARETGARIVHCCGYDSIPSDLGTLLLETYARDTHGARCPRVRFFAGESKGGFSGGTIASMVNLMEQGTRDKRVRGVLGNPYALVPDHEGRGPDGSDQRGIRFDQDTGKWTGPFLMAAINTRVVRRSNALMAYRYGKDFRYEEAMSFGPGAKGLAMATAVTAGITGFALGMVVSPLRKALVASVLPKPGEGPSKEARENGYFTSRLYGDVEGKPVKLVATVKGDQDPGYGATAKMIAESAVSLVRDDVRKEGGVLTPASCMGMPLVERLRKAGIAFDVKER